jgi:hypothetical protein
VTYSNKNISLLQFGNICGRKNSYSEGCSQKLYWRKNSLNSFEFFYLINRQDGNSLREKFEGFVKNIFDSDNQFDT